MQSEPIQPLLLASPGEQWRIAVWADTDGPCWSLGRADGRQIIAPSTLGLDTAGGPLGPGLHIADVSRQEYDETYPLLAGKASTARNHCREMTVSFADPSGSRRLDVVFRAYDDGIAFRYVLPQAEGGMDITGERTTWEFAENPRAWALHLAGFRTSFEGEYTTAALGDIAPDQLATVPFTLELEDGTGLAITEADLHDWAGLYLQTDSSGLRATLAPRADDPTICVRTSGDTQASPWRVVLAGDSPGALIPSTLVQNLNPPCALAETDWISPGKVSWD